MNLLRGGTQLNPWHGVICSDFSIRFECPVRQRQLYEKDKKPSAFPQSPANVDACGQALRFTHRCTGGIQDHHYKHYYLEREKGSHVVLQIWSHSKMLLASYFKVTYPGSGTFVIKLWVYLGKEGSVSCSKVLGSTLRGSLWSDDPPWSPGKRALGRMPFWGA